jgi:hypothetical protein
MPITSANISGVLTAAARVFADAVVTCGHTYTDAGGAHSQTFDALVGALSTEARMAVDGAWNNKAYILTVDADEFDEGRPPYELEELTVRRGDGVDETVTIVRTSMDPTNTVCVLTVMVQHD